MNKLISKFKSLSFEEKTKFSTGFSIVSNSLFAIGKIILSFFQGVFFLVAGLMNLFIMLSKLVCFVGFKNPDKKKFVIRNYLIAAFLFLGGVEYCFYMSRLIFTDVEVMKYDMILGICVALVSFIEMGLAIKGLFNSYGKGHYYRNIKLINLCSALQAIVTTEIALMSFAAGYDSRVIDGIFGLVVGGIILIIALFVIIAPKVSLVDYSRFIYQKRDDQVEITDEKIKIRLTYSRFYKSQYFIGHKKGDQIEGFLSRGKHPFTKWNIFIQILVITLSEILIFPYAIGALVLYFQGKKILTKLDEEMSKIGYYRIDKE